MNRLAYIASVRLPTEKAHGIQIMNMCNAFKNAGADLSLYIPHRSDSQIKKSPFDYYQIEENFEIKAASALQTVGRARGIGYVLHTLSFAVNVVCKIPKNTVCYVRSEYVAFICALFGRRVVWEVHQNHWNFPARYAIKKCKGLVFISKGLRDFYEKKGVLKNTPTIVLPDAVDIQKFNISSSKEQARKDLGIKANGSIVMYTGHLYDWKGADLLAQAATHISKNIDVYIIGGTQADIERFKKQYSAENVHILGKKPHADMPKYLKAADLLVIPNSAKREISRSYTSPLKLFEYMASQRPILAANIPSLREVLNEENAYFFEPDNRISLAQNIEAALKDSAREEKAQKAGELVKSYTWENRAKDVLNFIQEC